AAAGFQGLRISTPFPSQSAQLGEPITLTLTVKNFGLPPQTVSLRVGSAPPGWKATFLGGGRVVESVFVDPDQENTVTLRLEPPKGVRGGDYRFQVVATGQNASATLPVTLTLGNVLPRDRKSTRLNSSHDQISYAVFCLKKKRQITRHPVRQTCSSDVVC